MGAFRPSNWSLSVFRYGKRTEEDLVQPHKHRLLAIGIAATAALAVAPGASAKSKSMAYHGKFSGTASVLLSGSDVTIKTVSGAGGAGGLTKLAGKNGKGTSNGSCAFFSGVATLSGAKGAVKLHVKPTSQGCGDTTSATVKGSATAVGTSGKVKGTRGAVTFSGTFDQTTGAFTVTIKGTV